MTSFQFSIQGGDFDRAGSATACLKHLLRTLGADPASLRRAAIGAYEAELNVVIHARRGVMSAVVHHHAVDIDVVDEGPGIADLDLALQEGFSTAPEAARRLGFGAGLGLPNIKKNSDAFSLASEPGRGAHLQFRVCFHTPSLDGIPQNSVHIRAERCKTCLQCVRACPTSALRVRKAGPCLLPELCIDCGACIAVCPTGALDLDDPPAALDEWAGMPLVIPDAVALDIADPLTPAALSDCLVDLGVRDPRFPRTEAALPLGHPTQPRDAASPPTPWIAATCPAAVNLIASRFPALLTSLLPACSTIESSFRSAGVQLARAVVPCPATRSALLAAGAAPEHLLHPRSVRHALRLRLHARPHRAAPIAPQPDRGLPHEPDDVLVVHGIRQVLRTLDDIENGTSAGIRVVVPWACAEGCFGAPLLRANPAVSRLRARHWPVPLDSDATNAPARPPTARSGLRLDRDLGAAVRKLSLVSDRMRAFAGLDCACCGAPSCRSNAEDEIVGRVPQATCLRISVRNA